MKKVLIITYYWPPAGGPGVQRWLKFVKYLKEYAVEPIVFIPENPHYPIQDPSLKEEVPQDITILKKRIFEPYGIASLLSSKNTSTISSGIIVDEQKQSLLQKIMLYIRGNLFIPDARKFWVKPSVKYLHHYLKENPVDTIITTGPPHSVHLIGLELQKKNKLKWIADFRDPWTNIGYHKKLKLSAASQKKHLALEKKVLQDADLILTTSYTTAAEFEEKTAVPVKVITNGYDEVDVGEVIRDREFSIAHIGSLLSGRDPGNLWKVLGELVQENENFNRDLKIQLTGAISNEVLSSIKAQGLKDHVIVQGYVSHKEALRLQRAAQVLLLVEIDSEETRGIIAGKLFEYLAAARPILAVGPPNWDVNKILENAGAGKAFNYKEETSLKDEIQKLYRAYQAGSPKSTTGDIKQYSRRALTAQLAALIKGEWE